MALQSITFYIPRVNASIILIRSIPTLNPNFIDVRCFFKQAEILLFNEQWTKKKNQYVRIVSDVLLPLCFNRDVFDFFLWYRSGRTVHVNCFWGEFPSLRGALSNNSHSTNARQTLARVHCYLHFCSSATMWTIVSRDIFIMNIDSHINNMRTIFFKYFKGRIWNSFRYYNLILNILS